MPITSSAIKKARQDITAREHNRGIRDEFKKAVKNVKKLVSTGESKKAQEALKEAYSTIDRAAKKKIIHKNNAARRKSRLSALLSKKQPEKKTEVKKAIKKTTKK
jgi:small subunit ribosomal protein S20